MISEQINGQHLDGR